MQRESSGDQLSPQIRRSVQRLAERRLAMPALLFLAGHRPLCFVMGQLLYVAAPLATLLELGGWHEWADLLSDPDGPGLLEAALHAETVESSRP